MKRADGAYMTYGEMVEKIHRLEIDNDNLHEELRRERSRLKMIREAAILNEWGECPFCYKDWISKDNPHDENCLLAEHVEYTESGIDEYPIG